jgi:hypothetical protein
MPEIGNLAWTPLPAFSSVEIFDRFNGVPTLGVINVGREAHLFWRSLFYIEDVSVWLYVPLRSRDLRRLEHDTDADPLTGIVVRSAEDRFTAVAVAFNNRLIFEREWKLSKGLSAESVLKELVDFVHEALRIAIEQDPMPVSRRDVVKKAAEVVRELTPC